MLIMVCSVMFKMHIVLFFFFSSRRRHTRLVSDWSSDVCSSDLCFLAFAPVAIDCMKAKKHVLCEKLMAYNIQQCKDMIRSAEENRSEERRVGKECRSRGAPNS